MYQLATSDKEVGVRINVYSTSSSRFLSQLDYMYHNDRRAVLFSAVLRVLCSAGHIVDLG